MPFKDPAMAAAYHREYRRRNPEYAEHERAMSRAAKARRRGFCEECGAETRYNGKTINGASRLCFQCAVEEIGNRRRGTGSTNSRVIEYLQEPHTFTEIRQHFGLSRGWCSAMMHRLVRYGLVVRVKRGVYRAADGARVEG